MVEAEADRHMRDLTARGWGAKRISSSSSAIARPVKVHNRLIQVRFSAAGRRDTGLGRAIAGTRPACASSRRPALLAPWR